MRYRSLPGYLHQEFQPLCIRVSKRGWNGTVLRCQLEPGSALSEEERAGLRQSKRRTQVLKRNAHEAVGTIKVSPRPSAAALRRFEALWLEHRQELQLSKQSAAAVLDEVRKGRLPCDAALLRSRARTLITLDPLQPRLRLRQLLSSAPAAALSSDPQLLVSRAARFAAILPSYDTTHVLITVLPHIDRDPYVAAANFMELDDVFGAAFSGAHVPPSVFAYLLRAPGATVLPPPVPPHVSAAAAAPAPGAAAAFTLPAARSAAVATATAVTDAYMAPTQLASPATDGGAYGEGRALDPVPQPQERGAPKAGPQPAAQTRGRWQAVAYQRRHVDTYALLRVLRGLVSLFGRETAYVAVQRHPPLLDRDPWDMAARLRQLLAAVDPQVLHAASPLAAAAGASAGGANGALPARPAAHVLEDAPGVLDLEVGDVRRRLAELASTLEWGAPQAAQLVLHDPRVLARDPSVARENLMRLRLYALRRPATWGQELRALLSAGAPAKSGAAVGTSSSTTTTSFAQSGGARSGAKGNQQTNELGMWTGRTGRDAAAASSGNGIGRGAAEGPAAAISETEPVVSAIAPWAGDGEVEMDPDLLSLVGKILTVDEEVVDRAEYLVMSGERPALSLREMLYENRVRFVRHCPRYSRWWAEGAARQRGEGGGVFGLGSGLGLDEAAAEEALWEAAEQPEGERLFGAGELRTWDGFAEEEAGNGSALDGEEVEGAERLLGPAR